jgi:hypothetical protein
LGSARKNEREAARQSLFAHDGYLLKVGYIGGIDADYISIP